MRASGRFRFLLITALLAVLLALVASLAVLASRSSPRTPPAAAPSTSPPTPAPAAPSPGGPVSSQTSPAATCRPGDPLANVYSPSRLVVLDRCRSVTGVVTVVREEADGDAHINLALDPGQSSLLSPANRTRQAGDLVVEIVSADRPGCVPGRPPRPPSGRRDYGLCTGLRLAAPLVGLHVRVTGPLVRDTLHGWNEIHPAWVLTVLRP